MFQHQRQPAAISARNPYATGTELPGHNGLGDLQVLDMESARKLAGVTQPKNDAYVTRGQMQTMGSLPDMLEGDSEIMAARLTQAVVSASPIVRYCLPMKLTGSLSIEVQEFQGEENPNSFSGAPEHAPARLIRTVAASYKIDLMRMSRAFDASSEAMRTVKARTIIGEKLKLIQSFAQITINNMAADTLMHCMTITEHIQKLYGQEDLTIRTERVLSHINQSFAIVDKDNGGLPAVFTLVDTVASQLGIDWSTIIMSPTMLQHDGMTNKETRDVWVEDGMAQVARLGSKFRKSAIEVNVWHNKEILFYQPKTEGEYGTVRKDPMIRETGASYAAFSPFDIVTDYTPRSRDLRITDWKATGYFEIPFSTILQHSDLWTDTENTEVNLLNPVISETPREGSATVAIGDVKNGWRMALAIGKAAMLNGIVVDLKEANKANSNSGRFWQQNINYIQGHGMKFSKMKSVNFKSGDVVENMQTYQDAIEKIMTLPFTLELLRMFDVVEFVPVHGVVVRSAFLLWMESIIAMKPGVETGLTWYANPVMSYERNPTTRIDTFLASFYARSHVHRPSNVAVVSDIHIRGASSGHGTSLYAKPSSCSPFDHVRGTNSRRRDLYCLAIDSEIRLGKVFVPVSSKVSSPHMREGLGLSREPTKLETDLGNYLTSVFPNMNRAKPASIKEEAAYRRRLTAFLFSYVMNHSVRGIKGLWDYRVNCAGPLGSIDNPNHATSRICAPFAPYRING